MLELDSPCISFQTVQLLNMSFRSELETCCFKLLDLITRA